MLDSAIAFEKCIHHKPSLFIISGVSGVGKDATIRLMEKRKLPFHFVVTATSRPPRPNEINGVDYIFVSQQEFEDMIAKDQFIEHALVYNQYKGVPRSQVENAIKKGIDVVIRVDVQGAAKVKSLFPEVILIFLIPANENEWYKRLQERHTESAENLKIRIEEASKELECLSWFNYLVINHQGRLDETVDTIESIIRGTLPNSTGRVNMSALTDNPPSHNNPTHINAESSAAKKSVSVHIQLPTQKAGVTYTILGLTIFIYLLQIASQSLSSGGYDYPALFGMKINELILAGELWRLLTPMLLHASIPHIVFNMYALYAFGIGLERYYGHLRFFMLYILGGFAGNVCSFLLSDKPSLGASTAIFGLVAAEAIFIYRNRFLFGKRAGSMLVNTIIIVVINLILGLSPGIDNWGHLGGLIGGLAFAWFAGPVFKLQNSSAGLVIADQQQSNHLWKVAILETCIISLFTLLKFLFPGL